ncbi:hypothetical protein ACVXG9_26500 [Escherichia coli]
MGIAGSIVDHNFFESWLGMSPGGGYDRTASPYRSEDLRRSRTGNGTGLADKNFRYGEDENNKQYQRNAEQSRAVLRKVY